MLFLDTELHRSVEEAGGWKAAKCGEAGLAAAVTVDAGGRVCIYDAHTVEELAAEIEDAHTVVTYNGTTFDLPLISGVAGWGVRPRFHVDLLEVITKGMLRKGWSLHDTCQRTLGYGKTGNGARAPELAQAGRWGQLFHYCLQDVYLTKDLYYFIAKHGYVINEAGEQHMVSLPQRESYEAV